MLIFSITSNCINFMPTYLFFNPKWAVAVNIYNLTIQLDDYFKWQFFAIS